MNPQTNMDVKYAYPALVGVALTVRETGTRSAPRSCHLIQRLSRSLSENREPTAEKSLWPIFPLILVKYE